MTNDRRQESYRVRVEAAEAAKSRHHPEHQANGDEQRYAAAHYPMSFTKGLKHDIDLGVVGNVAHFEAFRACIDEGFAEPFTSRVHVPKDTHDGKKDFPRRKWEAPTAGIVHDLQGPDAQAVTMAPAPVLCSDELNFEMAEVYELALLRDTPFAAFDQGGFPGGSGKVNDACDRLNKMAYVAKGFPGRPRKTAPDGKLTRQTIFRGSGVGVENGPYLSQFLFIGGKDPASGMIDYGPQRISQKIPEAATGDDYMQDWDSWLRVQDGFDVNKANSCDPGQKFTGKDRFICTPRDLATYVHVDALYQAYLNATLILLAQESPFDPGFAKLSGMRDMYSALDSTGKGVKQQAGGFALWGGPHILTLVTEVATRALKAVRYQKFNTHLRLRPEALAARLYRAEKLEQRFPKLCKPGLSNKSQAAQETTGLFSWMRGEMPDTLAAIEAYNGGPSLLPMAFAEGSPMHPTYGAGHATVAGACTTIVKAYFDTGAVLGINADPESCRKGQPGFYTKVESPHYYETVDKGSCVEKADLKKGECPLTLEGELNKLAANISIGRNMAGVHYFSDYYDSLRMGEEIAIGLLQEQALCYPTDPFVLSVPTFDGEVVRIGRR